MTDAPGAERTEPTGVGWRRWMRAVAVAACVGGTVAGWTAAQFDTGPGQSLTFGSWSALWGGSAAVLGFGLGAWGTLGRVLSGVATGALGAVVGLWILLWRVPPWTLEGAWMYPLAGGLLLVASRLLRTPSGGVDDSPAPPA